MRSEINYLFIEKEAGRCEHLTQVLNGLNGQPMLPPKCNYEVINSTFDETLTEVLDSIDQQNARWLPLS